MQSDVQHWIIYAKCTGRATSEALVCLLCAVAAVAAVVVFLFVVSLREISQKAAFL